MKACPVCALELEDSYLFCPDDGSSLTATGDGTFTARAPGTEAHDETTSVVLYCPACGAEYPLTFSACPVHGVQLTRRSIQSLATQSDNTAFQGNETSGPDRPNINAIQFVPDDNASSNQVPDLAETAATASIGVESIKQGEKERRLSAGTSPTTEPQQPQSPISKDYEPEHQGFRIAAIATIIALGVFVLAGLYALGSNLSRRPATAARTASETETAQAVPFIVTPQETLNDKEEPPAASAAGNDSETRAGAPIVARSSKEFISPSSEQRDRKTTVAPSISTPPTQTTAVSAAARQASDPPAPVLPRASFGEFDSRLVRARASRISSGYRYDLTFNMQEQRGRAAQWQRVLITTRSAGGASHTQAIPFVHRLGATGALTFTISVELTGRSEADWRGQINCTTLGWDNTGAPLQASFAANVTP